MIKKFFTIFNVLGNDNKLKAFKLLLILLSILVLELLNLSLIIPMLTVILSENVNIFNSKKITGTTQVFVAHKIPKNKEIIIPEATKKLKFLTS